MSKKLFLVALFAALLIPFAGCSSDDDDDDPVALGIGLVAVGDDGAILTTHDTVTWSKVALTGSIATLDLVEVIKLPGTTVGYITYGQDSATTNDSEIWYSADLTTWTEATITELTGVRASTYFTITDMHFVNALEGVAVGTQGLVLWTNDAGLTWTEMNVWSDTGLTTNPGDLEIYISTKTLGTSPEPVQGDTLTQDQGGGLIVTADIVSWDYIGVEYVTVTNITLAGGATAFNSTDTVTWDTGSGTIDFGTIYDDDIWRYGFGTMDCIYGVEVAGTGTDTTLTFWMANDDGATYNGMWKLVSSAAVPGAARTWTWTTPIEAHQASTVASDFSYDDTTRFFFFDDMTGVAGRNSNGIIYTEDGGTTWTIGTNTDISAFNEYWSEFWYVDNGATGWLYSLENDGYVARVGMTYSATATPPYQFDTTAHDWDVLTLAGTNNSANNDDHTGVVLKDNNKVFAISVDGSGYWTYGSTIGSATFDDDVYTDTWDPFLGGVLANGNNPFEDKYIETLVGTVGTSYYMNHWTRR